MGQTSQTIAALSTPVGESGIAVIRITGEDTLAILSRIFQAKSDPNRTGAWEHRKLHYGVLVDPSGEAIDDVMCAVLRAPDSYTGEDTAEISCHGGPLIVSKVLDATFAMGARPAEPGEFTKRAFLNGKIDLIQAEAVCDLIHSKSELQRKVAHEHLSGGLSRRIQRLADEILELLGVIEANIDFIEEDIETLDVASACELLEHHRCALGELLSRASLSRPFREGYRVVISGPVNSGKSSLFNQMLGERRAIVTEIPGTTRDVLRESIVLEGLVFILQDTAGLRERTGDAVETIGMTLAEDAAGAAALVIFVIDGSKAFGEAEKRRVARLDPTRSVLVLNKMDLPVVLSVEKLGRVSPGFRIHAVSALEGSGIGALKHALVDCVGREALNWISRERVVLNSRLVSLLEEADRRAQVLEGGLKTREPLEILALEARELLECYEEATGKRYSENLLDTIFTRFCIGK
jgi:tRNA modification GTPase